MTEKNDAWIQTVSLPGQPFNTTQFLAWLDLETQTKGYHYLLAHSIYGVIWGRCLPDGHWQFSNKPSKQPGPEPDPTNLPELAPANLLELRLFGPGRELYLWKNEQTFSARRIADDENTGTEIDSYEENHLLWGTAQISLNGFTLMSEGSEGLSHSLPLTLKKDQRASLTVRHYIKYDATGQAYIAFSRLVNLKIFEE